MRLFLKAENQALDVKCTAWLAGFPYRNREVVIGNLLGTQESPVENYYKTSGELLNNHYNQPTKSRVGVDYIGPSIDTGFRLGQFSTGRKMVISIDAAYILSMTNFDGEIERIDLFYEGAEPLKGVFGGATYPVFWIDMSPENSLSRKEDKLKVQAPCNKEDIKEYCDVFYSEHDNFIFRPFIKGDPGQTFSKMPQGYLEYHSALVKNFYTKDIEDSPDDSVVAAEPSEDADPADLQKMLDDLKSRLEQIQRDEEG
jgi:hypothetical protein